MDPFEEFEMKPLTEGLGFHQKALKIKKEASQKNFSKKNQTQKNSQAYSQSSGSSFDSSVDALDKLFKESNRSTDKLSFTNPLPRPEDTSQKVPQKAQSPAMDFPLGQPSQGGVPLVGNIENEKSSEISSQLISESSQAKDNSTQRGASDSLVDNLK